MLCEGFLETELFEKNILHSSSFWWTLLYNEIWSFASAKAALLHRVPQSSKQWSWCCMSLLKGVLGSMPPTNWVKSQAAVGELLCVLAEPVVKHSIWGQPLQKGFAEHWRELAESGMSHTTFSTCGVPCPFSLFPSPYAGWGLPALGCSSSSVLTAGLRDDLSHLMLSLFYCRKPAKHCCLCPVEKLCGERAWG